MTTAAYVISRVEARAKVDANFAGVLEALLDAPPEAAGVYSRLAADDLNLGRRRQAIEEFRSGSLTTAQVQTLFGFATPQAVHRLRSRGKLIGMQIGNATFFPAWQFDGGGLRSDLPRLHSALAAFSSDTVATDRVMRLVRDDLHGMSIAQALDDPRLADAAWGVLAELAG